MTHDHQEWCETDVPGLHLLTGDGICGMRLLGWEGVLPLSVVRLTLAAPRKISDGEACHPPTPDGSAAAMAGADIGTAQERTWLRAP
ncbi:hypothetical protein GCM10010415_43350 [Streptomyces atrovirens]|uniref:Uncharacterized protein n=1 Tax=Streptomyces atrovirens TaxID=285556 RepID=A0ABW0DVJ8_9ACTN